MAIKLKLKSQEILDYQFQNVPRGYDALEVDKFLDNVIKDYLTIEKNSPLTKEEIQALKKQIEDLEKANENLRIENEKLKAKVNSIAFTEGVTRDNAHLMKRIDALERYLYKKGINPNDITK